MFSREAAAVRSAPLLARTRSIASEPLDSTCEAQRCRKKPPSRLPFYTGCLPCAHSSAAVTAAPAHILQLRLKRFGTCVRRLCRPLAARCSCRESAKPRSERSTEAHRISGWVPTKSAGDARTQCLPRNCASCGSTHSSRMLLNDGWRFRALRTAQRDASAAPSRRRRQSGDGDRKERKK